MNYSPYTRSLQESTKEVGSGSIVHFRGPDFELDMSAKVLASRTCTSLGRPRDVTVQPCWLCIEKQRFGLDIAGSLNLEH